MNDTIPTLFDRESYDDWIGELAEIEADVITEELYPKRDPGDINLGQVQEAVEHSGHLVFTRRCLLDAYAEVMRSTDTDPAVYGMIDPAEDDILYAAYEITRMVLVRDVTRQVRRELEARSATEAIA